MKILTVVGARPQFIKAALLSEAIRKTGKSGRIREVFVNTGQHYDFGMAQRFFEELSIPEPDYDLKVGPMSPVTQTSEIMRRLEKILGKEKPDMVLVYGDTNSTLAGALTAVRRGIPVAHVEAGLRSFDKAMPEEVNRVMTDHISSFLFCPTAGAVNNLRKENVTRGVYNTGDIMYELAMKMDKTASRKSKIMGEVGVCPGEYILATIHRQSNTDDPANLKAIVSAFLRIKGTIVLPVHPRTKKMLKK
ncbi:MAG: UDP-N-acetylglucosamine 2-epimerase (non-hydrolyzing), partial [Candidatus Omnitrophota bacterium]